MRGIQSSAVVLALGFLFAADSVGYAAGAKVTSIDFTGTTDPSQIEIHLQGDAQATQQTNAADKQVVIDIPGATLSGQASRSIDTSSFDGPVSLISPYDLKDKSGVRVVVQLRKNVTADFSQEGSVIKLSLPNDAGLPAPPVDAATEPKANSNNNDSNASADETTTTENATAAAALENKNSDVAMESRKENAAGGEETPAAPKTSIDQFVENSKAKQFTGRPITLKLRDADLRDVFSLIAETSGFNIVLAPDVQGTTTLSLEEVPWDQALSVVLQTNSLGAERKGNVLRVMTLSGLTKERQAEQEAKKAGEAIAPKMTRIFPVSYAQLSALRTTIEGLLTQEKRATSVTGAAGATTVATSGPTVGDVTVLVDDRTNSLIVRTTSENMEKVRKIIDILDTQTPQVLIEGKVIEASENFGKSISGNLGFGKVDNSPLYAASFNGSNPIDPLLGSSAATTTATTVFNGASFPGSGTGGLSTNGGAFGYSIFPQSVRLNMFLQLNETESKVKVIASPKAVVMNKQTANVVQGTPVIVPSTVIGANGVAIATTDVKTANLSLNVTPTVTSDGSVLMDLTLERDIPVTVSGGTANNAVATRNIKTNVLVDSGSTLVMGGFFTTTEQHNEAGFPFLRQIPILGWLFGSNSDTTDKSELFFFITPQVINPKKAGISG